MISEEEAWGKWCPMARVSVTNLSDGNHAANRFDGRDSGAHDNAALSNCIGRRCMVWVGSMADSGRGRCGLVRD